MSAPHPDYTKRNRTRKPRWHRADNLVANYSASENEDTETSADESFTHVGSTSTQQPLRGMNMNAYPSQPGARQTPRLQNTQKTAVGNGGWGSGFGMGGQGGGGGGGFGGAPGLGQQQPRPSQLSGFAQVMGGGGQQGPIDMSDFPSLSGGPRPTQSSAAAAGWNSNAIRQPSQSSQPPGQQRAPSAAPSQQSLDQFEGQRAQPQQSERQQSGDDFPPLGGQLNGDMMGQTPSGFASSLGSPDIQHARTNGQQAQLPIRESSGSYQQPPQQPPIGPPPPQSQQAPTQNGQAPPASNVKRYADMTENEKWGLQGLMASFEARRQMESGGQVDDSLPPELRNGIMMGQDLDQLGMDLNQDGPLYTTFTPFPAVNMSGSSYDYHDRHMVPDYHLPAGYTVNNVPPLPGRMSAFSDETLFTVFYQHPRDILQEFAANELVGRDWRWHKVLRQWLQKDTKESNAGSSLPLVDLTQGVPIGVSPMRINERSERGVYVFFEASNWRRERREFLLDYEELENKVMPGVAPGMPLIGGPVGAGGAMGGQGLGQGQGQGSSQVPGA